MASVHTATSAVDTDPRLASRSVGRASFRRAAPSHTVSARPLDGRLAAVLACAALPASSSLSTTVRPSRFGCALCRALFLRLSDAPHRATPPAPRHLFAATDVRRQSAASVRSAVEDAKTRAAAAAEIRRRAGHLHRAAASDTAVPSRPLGSRRHVAVGSDLGRELVRESDRPAQSQGDSLRR